MNFSNSEKLLTISESIKHFIFLDDYSIYDLAGVSDNFLLIRDEVYYGFIDEFNLSLKEYSINNLYVIHKPLIESLKSTLEAYHENKYKLDSIDYSGFEKKHRDAHKYRGEVFSKKTLLVCLKNLTDIYLKLEVIIPEKEKTINTTNEKENPHPQIFKNGIAFDLFESMQEHVKDNLADYSFIYHVMIADKYIIPEITQSVFVKWLRRIYPNIIIGDKLKTLVNCKTSAKESIYYLAKQHYKP